MTEITIIEDLCGACELTEEQIKKTIKWWAEMKPLIGDVRVFTVECPYDIFAALQKKLKEKDETDQKRK